MQKRPGVLYLGNKLSKKGATVTSIETLGSFLKQEGYTVYTASGIKNKVFRMLHMLYSIMKHSRRVSYVLIDTYSTQNFYFALASANLCRLLKVPYIPILRGGNLPERLEKNKALSWKLFNGAEANVAPSGYLMQAFNEQGYNNLTYIPNTIQLKDYPFKMRDRFDSKMLWVRSFAEIYNPMMAIEVLQGLRDQGRNVSLCMVGPDKDGSLKKCESFAIENDLPVTFTGKLEKHEWIDLASKYDVFINTTDFDNTPVSVIEAMALGLPVVSTSVGGVPFLIEDRQDGLLVPPRDTESFLKAVNVIMDDPALGSTLAKNAREKAESFDWEKVKQLWFALLSE